MRERIVKGTTGSNNIGRKEVRIKINKSGLSASGEQRYALAARFADESHKKVSNNGYSAVEIDRELHRIYFVPASPDEGFKFTGTKSEKNKSITFTIQNRKDWEDAEGCYFLLKDPKENLYYIDYSSKKEK